MTGKKYFSYIRVSTQRQGEQGTSLAEQQAAIDRFAVSNGLNIIRRFAERETAAKLGRPVFLTLLKELRAQRACGVIIHKIDRSARHLTDWADLMTLTDSGVEVYFASESLDLRSRGGRLSADIQAVVASDYIRNLREETKKGLYGRLRQGLFPFRAPAGYLDRGKGNAKAIDPVSGRLIRETFELYSTGDWGMIDLADRLYLSGLKTKNGNRLSLNGLSTILHNPFYKGVIRIAKTGEHFTGIHTPLISTELFDQVQDVLAGKNVRKKRKHEYTYRKLIRCQKCGYRLIPEKQKGLVYYRCHTRKCLPSCVKEETVTSLVLGEFKRMEMEAEEYELLKRLSRENETGDEKSAGELKKGIKLELDRVRTQQERLIDTYMDGMIDKEMYLRKKEALVTEERSLTERLESASRDETRSTELFELFLELANSAYLSFKTAESNARRVLLDLLTSNFLTDGSSLTITLGFPFEILAGRPSFQVGSPYRETARTSIGLLKKMYPAINEALNTKNDDGLKNYLISKKKDTKRTNNYHYLVPK